MCIYIDFCSTLYMYMNVGDPSLRQSRIAKQPLMFNIFILEQYR